MQKKRKQQISESNLQVFDVTTDADQELQHFLVSRTEGEALEVSRGAEREPGPEEWRRLAYVPLKPERSLDDTRQNLSPPKKTNHIDDLSHALQAWENLEPRHKARTEDQLPKDI